MTAETGGGASRSTDPAAGSSAATDVSLREFTSERIDALDRHLTSGLEALHELMDAHRNADQEAVKLALKASQDLAEKHNDLIRQGERKDATYATKDEINVLVDAMSEKIDSLRNWQSKITGGLILIGVIGVTNLVKLWS